MMTYCVIHEVVGVVQTANYRTSALRVASYVLTQYWIQINLPTLTLSLGI